MAEASAPTDAAIEAQLRVLLKVWVVMEDILSVLVRF